MKSKFIILREYMMCMCLAKRVGTKVNHISVAFNNLDSVGLRDKIKTN